MGALVQQMRLDFEHPAFGRAGAHFAVSTYREIVFRVELGELNASIDLDQVAGTFGLPQGARDRRLLKLVPAAIRYRRRICSGDVLPSETIDGSPSWAPKPHLLIRAVRRIGHALGAPGLLSDNSPPADGIAREALENLARVVRDRCNPRELDLAAADIAQVAMDTARVDWLCRAVIGLQQDVGAVARLAAGRQNAPRGESARAIAHGMRDAVVWASTLAMRLDAVVADPLRAFGNIDDFRRRLWPGLASLRAFALDIEPFAAAWGEARDRRGGPTDPDLEALYRLVAARYQPFDARAFEWRRIQPELLVPTGASTPTDDARGANVDE